MLSILSNLIPLRNGGGYYQTIFGINFVNVVYFFVTKPSNDADPLKIIVTSLATVLTSTMTMRVILLVRGSLAAGGSFHGSSAPTSGNSASLSGGGVGHTGSGSGAGNRAPGSAPFHITASGPGPAVSSMIGGRSMRTSKDLSSPVPGTGPISRSSNAGNGGMGGMNNTNKMSQPTFAVPHPGDDLDYEGTYAIDADADVKTGDVADEVDVWERNKEGAGKRTEAWEQRR